MHPFLPLAADLKDGSRATLRMVRPADAEALCELTRLVAEVGEGMARTTAEVPQTAEETAVGVRRWMRERRGLFIVAERDARIMAQADIRVPPLTRLAHVGHFTVSVHPASQGLGLGRAMTQAALDWAQESGLEQVNLTVFAANERARKLYASLGFVEQGLRRKYIRYREGEYDDDVLMVWEADASTSPSEITPH